MLPRSFESVSESLRVWIDQDLCTGDGLCVQYAPEVFEFDVDGLAYVKEGDGGELLSAPGARADVPDSLRLDVISSAKECPGECIHVVRRADDTEVAGPDAS
jgi:ferredoxin